MVHLFLPFGIGLMKIKMNRVTILFLFIFSSFIFSQGDFDLEDLNPNSDTFGQLIGPGDYIGDICIVFFGHEY